MLSTEPPDEPSDDPSESAPASSLGLNPNASSFVFNPSVASFAPPSGGLSVRRLPSVSEDDVMRPETSPAAAEAEQPVTESDKAEDSWKDGQWAEGQWDQGEQEQWTESQWKEWEEGQWAAGEDGEVWDENGYYDENGTYVEYSFQDYLDDKGEYWLDSQKMPAGMLGGTPWPRRGGHDRSHWHQSGTSSASTSPFTQATLQGANLQPWCGKLVLPTAGKEGDVTKYDSSFLLQFQNTCTTTPAELKNTELLVHGPRGLGARAMNTPFKNKNRAPGSDRSTLLLDGMVGRNDLFNQQDLHVPQRKQDHEVVTYNSDFLMQFQHMSGSIPNLPGFQLPDLPGVTASARQQHPATPSLVGAPRSSRKSGKKPRGGTGPKVASRSKFPNSVFTDHPEQRTVGPSSKGSPWAKAPQFTGPVEPLQQTTNRWCPRDKGSTDDLELLRARVLGILNKMTPEKFERLLKQLLEVKITNKETMSMVIGSIFDKAVAEPAYATMYADLCQRLSSTTPQVEQHGEVHTFKRMLLKKCYDNFMNEAEEVAEAIEGEEQEEAEERFTQAKKRMLGNVTLIGELFKKGLLTENIIKICITLLLEESLEDPDFRDIEALCLLLSIVGQLLNQYVETIMPQIQELSESSLLPARMRFMLESVIDLKKNKWVPRREKMVTPKKLKEVHSAGSGLKRTSSYQSPFASKLNRSQLTPSQTPTHPMARSFSDGHAAVMVDPELVQNLRLRRKCNISESIEGSPLERSDSRDRGFSEWEMPAPPEALISSVKQPRPAVSQNIPTDITQPPSGFHKPAQPTSSPEPMSAALFEKRMGSLLDEYLASSDEVEAWECVKELSASDTLLNSLPTVAVLHVLEKKPADRKKVDALLLYLHKQAALSEENAVAGMTSLMEQMPDLEMDVPMYGKYIATTIASLIGNDAMKPAALKDIFGDMLGTSHAPKVALWLFDALVSDHGLEAAQKSALESTIPALHFIPGEDKSEEEIQRWLKKVKCQHDLAWLFNS